jgi:DNA-binding MarR family transcriptional regulator
MMGASSIDLDTYFPFFLGTVANRWTAASSRTYLEEFGLGIGEWRVLASIQSLEQASSQQIVVLIAMDAGAVSRAIRRLQDEGMIKAVKGKFPGRTKPFSITPLGEATYTAMARSALEREAVLLADLDAQERTALLSTMRKIRHRAEQL